MSDVLFVPVDATPEVSGLCAPMDIYWILRRPAPLAGMSEPTLSIPWKALSDLGVRHVVCLSCAQPSYNPAPVSLLCAVQLQDLYGGILPAAPRDEEGRIRLAVDAIVQALRARQGVAIHCVGGTGRTGTVIGAVLVALGVRPARAIARIQAVNKKRGRSWPESPWQEDLVRRFKG